MDECIQEDDILLFYCDISYSMILYSDLKSFEEHSLLTILYFHSNSRTDETFTLLTTVHCIKNDMNCQFLHEL